MHFRHKSINNKGVIPVKPIKNFVMRKILSLLLSAVMTFSLASAQQLGKDVRQLNNSVRASLKKEVRKAEPQRKTQEAESAFVVTAKMKSLQKVAELDGSPVKRARNGNVFTIEGQYSLTLGDYYFSDSRNAEFTTNATISYSSQSQCYLLDCNEFPAAVGFDYNNITKKMSFFQSYVGISQGYYIVCVPFYWDWNQSSEVWINNYDVVFNDAIGAFTFEADHGFAWPAFTNSSFTNWGGQYLDMYDVVKGVQAGGGESLYDDDKNWQDAGTAVLVDGWVLPVFGVDPEDPEYWYEVPIQQSTINSSMYRLVDPYHCNPKFDRGDNTSTNKGYIRFDVSDANHVVFEAGVEAGWANPDAGVSMMFCYNQLGWYMASYDVPASTVISQLGNNIPYTTYKNGVVSLDYIVDRGEKIYDATFGYQANPLLGGLWPGENMTARIYMPGTAALAILDGTAKANATDKTATITFDYVALGVAGNSVYANVTINGNSTRVEVKDGHAEVLVEGLEPQTKYTATVSIEAGKDASPTINVPFTTDAPAQSITVKELRASASKPVGTASVEVELETEGLAADAQVNAYFKLDKAPYAEYAQMTFNDGMYLADLSGLAAATEYTVTVYAESGDVRSEEKSTTFTTPEAAPELPAIPEGAEVIYADGKLREHLNVELWWNASANFQATNPTGADNQVFEFKAGNLTYDWGQGGYADASMGLNMVKPANTGSFHDGTLNFGFYPTAASGAKYTVRLTSAVASEDYDFTISEDQVGKWNTMSLSIPELFPEVAEEWKDNKNEGEGYVFSIIISNGTEADVMYLNNIYYTDVDTEWEAPEIVIPTPETVPVPAHDAADVMSFYSLYGDNVSYGIGGWGQRTNQSEVEVDGKEIIRLRNFDYLGWDNFNINISDYDYMHVDYWTPNEGTVFGFVPISLDPTKDTPIWNAPEVKANEWNSYDAPLAGFDADLSAIRQIKFVANQEGGLTEVAYIANVYFYKEVPEIEITRPDVEGYDEEFDLVGKNAYAYDIKVTPYEGDPTKAVVQYRLNGKAKSVTIQPMVDGQAVSVPVAGTTNAGNTVDVHLEAGEYTGKLTYAITVESADDVEAATLVQNEPVYYQFWSPTTIAVNTDPETSTFGRALTVENRYHATPFGNSAYHAVGRGAAVYAFDPRHTPVLAEDGKPGFKFGLADNTETKTQVYGDYQDLQYAPGNVLYLGSADLNKEGLYEIDPDDMDATAQPMFESGVDHRVWAFDSYTYADGSTKFVIVESNDASAGQGNGVTAGRVMIYDLGEDGYLTNGKRVAEGYGFPNGLGMKVRIDPDGKGFYVSSHRGDAKESEPHMIHSDMEGNLDVNDYQSTYNCGAMGYNRDNTLFARVEGNATVVVYSVDANNGGEAPAMTKLTSFNASIGNPVMAVAFDYANNIYVSGNNQEKFQQFRLPASIAGASTTVASPSSQAIALNNVTTGIGNVAVDAEDGNAVYYNLSGIQMPAKAKLPAGVYIKVVGKKATKVVVK